MAGSASMKRIKREILDLSKDSADMGDIALSPSETSIYEWKATIPGPSGSPYAGGLFNLAIHLPNDYPFSAPKVVFSTQIYHPNISPQGAICIDILKGAWSPALSLFKVMLSLSSLLTDPNPSDPLVPAIAQEYLKKRALFDQKAREWTAKYAMANVPKSKQSYASAAAVTSTSSPGSVNAQSVSSSASAGLLASLVGFATGRYPSSTPQGLVPPAAQHFIAPPSEPSRRVRSTRQAASSASTRSSRPAHSTGIIDLDDDEMEPAPIPAMQTRRKRKREEEDLAAAAGASVASSSRPSRRRNPPSVRETPEIIVLEED